MSIIGTPLTAVQSERWTFYYNAHFPAYRDMLSKLTECIAQLNACNKQYTQMKSGFADSYIIEQIMKDRQIHLRVQETFAQALVQLQAFSGKLHSMIELPPPALEEPQEQDLLCRDQERTALAAAKITLSMSELQSKLQKGVRFYARQSDALFKVITSPKPLYRLNSFSWWVARKENDEDAALSKNALP